MYRGNVEIDHNKSSSCINTLIKNLNSNFIFIDSMWCTSYTDKCHINEPVIKLGNSNVKQYLFIYVREGSCYFNQRFQLNKNDYIIVEYDDKVDIYGTFDKEISKFSLYYKSIYLCKELTNLILVDFNVKSNIYGLQIRDLDLYKDLVYYKVGDDVCFYHEELLTENEFMFVWDKIYPKKMTDEIMKKLEYTGMKDFCKGLDEFHKRDEEIMDCLEKEGIKVEDLPKVPTSDEFKEKMLNN